MFTVISLFRTAGFNVSCWPKYEAALDLATKQTLANNETTAVIYNERGELIWRAFGNVFAPPPAPPVAIQIAKWTVRDTDASILLECDTNYQAVEVAKQLAVKNDRNFYVFTPIGVLSYEAIPNPRSIFSDVDVSGNKTELLTIPMPDPEPSPAPTHEPPRDYSSYYEDSRAASASEPSVPDTSSSDSSSSPGGD